jgi:SpoVK/Ycf46/Vps4 family AAA+-type ATPase
MLQYVPSVASCVIILGPEFKPHTTIEKLVVVTDYDLPTEGDLTKIAKEISSNAGKEFDGNAAEIVRALSGLSTTEAENACALSLVEEGLLDPAIIYREKISGVKKTGLLEIAEPDPRGLDSVGGLDAMKTWIMKRKRALTPDAVAYGLPAPKGVLIVGVPGTGKSLSAKAIGTALGVPTLRLDIGALFNSLVGESESRTRSALNLAEALAPCVVWVDEVDKGLAGASGSGAGDSGVTKRVFGTIITWMQERKRPVFLVATANDVTNLPPEFLRRWDEIFAVDLPNEEERAAIFQIHLLKRGRERLAGMFAPLNQNASLTITATNDFTGSEIEKVIEAAMFDAFDDGGREFTIKDIIVAAGRTTPLAVTAKEKVDAIRDWAKTRATWASTKAGDVQQKPRVVRSK